MNLRVILRNPWRKDEHEPPFAMDVPAVRPTDMPTSMATPRGIAYIIRDGVAVAEPWLVPVRQAFDESYRAVRARLSEACDHARVILPLLASGQISPQTLASIMVDRTFLMLGLPSRASHARPQPQLVAA